jgi:hypothetical protein
MPPQRFSGDGRRPDRAGAGTHRGDRAAATLADLPYNGDWDGQDRSGRIFTVHVMSSVMLDDGRPTGSSECRTT